MKIEGFSIQTILLVVESCLHRIRSPCAFWEPPQLAVVVVVVAVVMVVGYVEGAVTLIHSEYDDVLWELCLLDFHVVGVEISACLLEEETRNGPQVSSRLVPRVKQR